MRYYVAIRAWRQGEFEAAVEEVKRNNPVGVSIFSSSFDPLYKKQSKGYILEAESKETVELTCFYSHSLGNILEKKLEQHD